MNILKSGGTLCFWPMRFIWDVLILPPQGPAGGGGSLRVNSLHFFLGEGFPQESLSPPITPVLFQELCQWNMNGLICRKSQKKAVKSILGYFVEKMQKRWPDISMTLGTKSFEFWLFFGSVMAILLKNISKITKLLFKCAKYLVFSRKLP